jgi:FixJ family two-component response regulator
MSEPNTTQAPPAILFVDDEATAVKYFQRAIGQLAPVVTGGSVEEGKALLDAHGDSLAVLVSDQRMPGEYGNELLRYARERYPHIVRILTTAYSELDQTVEAVNQGQIHRYIKKPWDITALRMEMKQALELSGLRRERDQLVREKLMVLQKQTVATRVGMVHAICASLIGPGRFQPVETYLAGTSLAVRAMPSLTGSVWTMRIWSARKASAAACTAMRLARSWQSSARAWLVVAPVTRRRCWRKCWVQRYAATAMSSRGPRRTRSVSSWQGPWPMPYPTSTRHGWRRCCGWKRLVERCNCSAKATRSRHARQRGLSRLPRTGWPCGSSN